MVALFLQNYLVKGEDVVYVVYVRVFTVGTQVDSGVCVQLCACMYTADLGYRMGERKIGAFKTLSLVVQVKES